MDPHEPHELSAIAEGLEELEVTDTTQELVRRDSGTSTSSIFSHANEPDEVLEPLVAAYEAIPLDMFKDHPAAQALQDRVVYPILKRASSEGICDVMFLETLRDLRTLFDRVWEEDRDSALPILQGFAEASKIGESMLCKSDRHPARTRR